MPHHRGTEGPENANSLFNCAARVDFVIEISLCSLGLRVELQILKLSPHPQVRLALGFTNWKPFPFRPPLKSKVVPRR